MLGTISEGFLMEGGGFVAVVLSGSLVVLVTTGGKSPLAEMEERLHLLKRLHLICVQQ